MSDLRIKWNPAGIRQILRGEPMLADVDRRAEQIASAAGPGHRVEAEVGKNRARAVVITDTDEAVRAEIRDHALTRALDAGRD